LISGGYSARKLSRFRS